MQPYIRNTVKNYLYLRGYLSTTPTEEGAKNLDVFHPSYRVKNIDKRRLDEFNVKEGQTDNGNKDIFLDILQCES